MRRKVREVHPPTALDDLEVLTVEDVGVAGGPTMGARGPDSAADDVRVDSPHRAVTAADLGPNGASVLALLTRAAGLSPAQRRDIERDATWRWGLLAIVPAAPAMPVARAVALMHGRRDGRSEAIDALQAEAGRIARTRTGKGKESLVAASIFNAGLAVLVRDIIEPEVFEVLFGPWRAVMHH